jgi:hypothetical protein
VFASVLDSLGRFPAGGGAFPGLLVRSSLMLFVAAAGWPNLPSSSRLQPLGARGHGSGGVALSAATAFSFRLADRETFHSIRSFSLDDNAAFTGRVLFKPALVIGIFLAGRSSTAWRTGWWTMRNALHRDDHADANIRLAAGAQDDDTIRRVLST